MKVDILIAAIHLNTILILLTLISFSQSIKIQLTIPNCIKTVYAPSLFNRLQRDELLCVECQLGYVVSQTFKECFDFRYQLAYFKFANCKRIGQDGFCAEAIRGIELTLSKQYIFSKDMKYSDRCAIVSDDYSKCLSPRLGYKLDIQTNELLYDTEMSFCALFDSKLGVCQLFQARFVRIYKTQMGAYLGDNFINVEKLASISTSFYLICEHNYTYRPGEKYEIFRQYEDPTSQRGCIEQSFFQNDFFIENCTEQHLDQMCEKCAFDYALKNDQSECRIVIPNCYIFAQIENTNICIRCFPCYKLESFKCIYMPGCTLVSEHYPNKILACNPFYRLMNDECVLDSDHFITLDNTEISVVSSKLFEPDVINGLKRNNTHDLSFRFTYNCLLQNEQTCLKCENPSFFYYDKEKGECVKRRKSQNCKYYVYNKDLCINFECAVNNVFNYLLLDDYVDFKQIENLRYFQYLNDQLTKKFKSRVLDDEDVNELFQIFNSNGYQINNNSAFCVSKKSWNLDLQSCVKKETFLNICTHCQYDQLYFVEDSDENFFSTTCISNYNVNDKIINCETYEASGKICLQCKPGYYYNSQRYECMKKIENCFLHTKNGGCFKCMDGFNIDLEQSYCSPICSEITYSNNQLIYHSLFTYKNINLEECKQTNIPCLHFIDNVCVECFEGYVLDQTNNSSCIQDSYFSDCKKIDFVHKNDKSGGDRENESVNYEHEEKQCILCKDNYRLYKGRCYCQLPQCLRAYNCSEDNCHKQQSSLFHDTLNIEGNVFLEKIGLVYYVFECRIEKCVLCEEGNVCSLCFFGYHFDKVEMKCFKNSNDNSSAEIMLRKFEAKGCFHSSPFGCVQCKGHLYLMTDFRCYLECPTNYETFNDANYSQHFIQNRLCYRCPKNCNTCDFQPYTSAFETFQCNSCVSGYYFYPHERTCRLDCPLLKGNIKHKLLCTLNCDNYFRFGNECVQECPHYYLPKLFLKERFCVETCEPPLFKYQDSKECSYYCKDGYVSGKDSFLCLECKASSCLRCSNQNLNECALCETSLVSINGQCKAHCQNGEMVDHIANCGILDRFIVIPYCQAIDNQNYDKCSKCFPTFILTSRKECKCPQQYYLNRVLSRCFRCDEHCQKCDENQQCTQCNPNFKLISYNATQLRTPLEIQVEVQDCVEQCPIGYYSKEIEVFDSNGIKNNILTCQTCSLQGCIRCKNENECSECSSEYELIENVGCECRKQIQSQRVCKYRCFHSTKFVDDLQQCCQLKNCEVCSDDMKSCLKCKTNTPYLFLNTCLEMCPEGTFADPTINVCKKCSQLCLTCAGNEYNCTKCILPHFVADVNNSCKCFRGMFFFENSCYKECPRLTKQSEKDGVCMEYCQQYFEYPIFNDSGDFERCESLYKSPQSKFCEQNIHALNKLITFSLDTNEQITQKPDSSISTIISIAQTPKDCYTFKLRWQNIYYFDLYFKGDNNQNIQNYIFELQTLISFKTLTERNIQLCSVSKCSLFFDIFLKDSLELTIKLNLFASESLIQIEGIQNKIDSLNKNYLLKRNDLSESQIIPSSYQLQCNSSNCKNQLINSTTNYPIELKIYEKTLITNSQSILTFYPLSIFIEVSPDSYIPQNNYYYVNSQPSEIKITLYFEKPISGTLNIICAVSDKMVLSKEEFLNFHNNKNKKNKYATTTVEINIQEYQIQGLQNIYNNAQQQTSLILTLFTTMIFILLILFLLINCIKQSRINNTSDQLKIFDGKHPQKDDIQTLNSSDPSSHSEIQQNQLYMA